MWAPIERFKNNPIITTNMYEDLLQDIGLTKSEVSVYFALLEIGSSTTGPIIKKAQIASGKAYLILDKLVQKGLVTHVIQSNIKYYQAKDPEKLLDFISEKETQLQEKKEQLRNILPKLKAQFEEHKYQPRAEIYEGWKGFKSFYDSILKELKKGDTIYIQGVPKSANEKMEGFITAWNEQRIKLGIKMQILYNHDNRQYGEKRKRLPLTEVRFLKQEMETPSWIDVFGDYVANISVQENPVVFVIKNKAAASSYRNYFKILWKNAER